MTNYDTYDRWLKYGLETDASEDKTAIQESLVNEMKNSASYQEFSTINGIVHPLVVTRKNTKKSKVSTNDTMALNIGDMVGVFGENWICVEKHIDEYGIAHGEIWMCNHVFKFLTGDGALVEKHTILDNGSYSANDSQTIRALDGGYTCYMSLDNESNSIYIDKRLAIDKIINSNNEEVLQVGKVVDIDRKSRNFGAGSHLLVFKVNNDVYNKETDDINLIICDYKPNLTLDDSATVISSSPEILETYTIEGKDELRIGSTRTYRLSNEVDGEFTWIIENEIPGIIIDNVEGVKCSIKIQPKEYLIGNDFVIRCTNTTTQEYGTKKVVIING